MSDRNRNRGRFAQEICGACGGQVAIAHGTASGRINHRAWAECLADRLGVEIETERPGIVGDPIGQMWAPEGTRFDDTHVYTFTDWPEAVAFLRDCTPVACPADCDCSA